MRPASPPTPLRPALRSARAPHVAIVGAGMGGLAAAIDLARQGLRVTVCERQERPGGKLRTLDLGGPPVDSGPTVLTLKEVFARLFADAGADLDQRLRLHRSELLARHSWSDGTRLDLFDEAERSRAEIARVFGDREADGFTRFSRHCASIYEEVHQDFIFGQRPTLAGLVARGDLSDFSRMWKVDTHRSMWRAVSSFFEEPKLRQLFGRYATYTGSSPFQAPGTLNVVAHVEQRGVWTVEGGMGALVQALVDLALELGVELRTGAEVAELRVVQEGGVRCARGLRLVGGAEIAAEAVVLNADVSALGRGFFGPHPARAVSPIAPKHRSLSALTFSALARSSGFPLAHHSVFFSDDSPREFAALERGHVAPSDPTVYLCAQDRPGTAAAALSRPDEPERILFILNAPADGEHVQRSDTEVQQCLGNCLAALKRHGLDLRVEAVQATRPQDFAALYPGTGGALYGARSLSWKSSFDRSGARTKMPGLYLAGGSVHPGAGLPMVATSGRLAAACVMQDLASTPR